MLGSASVTNSSPQKPENPWPNLVFNIVLPTLIMMKLSPIPGAEGSPAYAIGPTWAVILGLALPVGYGIYDYAKKRRVNFFSILGIVAVLLKGSVMLAKGNPALIIWVETGIPLLLGVICLATAWMKKPLIQRILLNPQVIDHEKLNAHLDDRGNQPKIRPLMVQTSVLYAGLMVISAILNFALATRILKADPKVDEVTAVQELGKLQGLQFPVIGLPLMILSIGLLVFVLHRLGKLAGIPALHLMRGYEEESDSENAKT